MIFILWGLAILDEAPAWKEFIVHSENKKWTAVICQGLSEDLGRDAQWTLSIYKGYFTEIPPQTSAEWSQQFVHTGYSSGSLSNGGDAFAVLEPWYLPGKPLVYIYSRNCIQRLGWRIKAWGTSITHELWIVKPERFAETPDGLFLSFETKGKIHKIKVNCEGGS